MTPDLEQLLKSVPGTVYRRVHDEQGTWIYKNGRSATEFVEEGLRAAIHPADQQRVWDSVTQATDSFRVEYRLVAVTGEERWVRDEGTIVKRNPLEVEGHIEDITHYSIWDNIPVGISIMDRTERIVYTNPKGQEILGKAFTLDNENLTRKYGVFRAGTDTPYDENEMPIVRGIRGEVTAVTDMDIRSGDRTVTLSVCGAPKFAADGSVEYSIVVFTDITEEKKAAAERQQLRKQVEQAQRMNVASGLARGAAHEFNNLLAKITAFAEIGATEINSYESLVAEKITGEEKDALTQVRSTLTTIAEEAMGGKGLTKMLMQLGKAEPMKQEVIDLHTIIEKTAHNMRKTAKRNVSVFYTADPAAYTVYADVPSINQVLTNLSMNAQQAMPDGGELRFALSKETVTNALAAGVMTPGDYAVLQVSDTGVGIPAEKISRIFEPGYTTKSLRDETGGGLGIGLSIVYSIMEQHKGTIRVKSEVGKGTTFSLYFPLTDNAVLAETAAPLEAPPTLDTILVVEDEFSVRRLVEKTLNKQYHVISTPTADEGWQQYQAHRDSIRMVISDNSTPGRLSGNKLIEQILAEQPTMKTLMISGAMYEGGESRSPVLAKPFTMDELVQRVRQAFQEG